MSCGAARNKHCVLWLGLQVAGKQMVKLMPHLVHANHTMGIDAETGHVGELTVEQVAMAATTAFDRAIQVRKTPPSQPRLPFPLMLHPSHTRFKPDVMPWSFMHRRTMKH